MVGRQSFLLGKPIFRDKPLVLGRVEFVSYSHVIKLWSKPPTASIFKISFEQLLWLRPTPFVYMIERKSIISSVQHGKRTFLFQLHLPFDTKVHHHQFFSKQKLQNSPGPLSLSLLPVIQGHVAIACPFHRHWYLSRSSKSLAKKRLLGLYRNLGRETQH